jgi:hypothetical protein
VIIRAHLYDLGRETISSLGPSLSGAWCRLIVSTSGGLVLGMSLVCSGSL